MQNTFKPQLEIHKHTMPNGGLAVVFDKNPMENSGYAAAMADVCNEVVWLTELHEDDPDPPVTFRDGVMYIRDHTNEWHAIRACFRYVTQRPWTRVPTKSKTIIINSIQACLAGGRNKMVADKAYESFNVEMASRSCGLSIRVPYTIRDCTKDQIPALVQQLGNKAVVKVPYSNAGQGVYTITNDYELQDFMKQDHRYDKFIVQSLVGNATWSSTTQQGQYFHTGTIPNRKNQTFVSDLRMMVSACDWGWQPLAIYARRAHQPLTQTLNHNSSSWSMLGTNLSYRRSDGEWGTESERLLLMDHKDFNTLGLGIDDLCDAYVQTVMAATAIDNMAKRLVKPDGSFDIDLFASLNSDQNLLNEIMQ